MLKSLVIAATLLAAPAANARPWYSVDNNQQQCTIFSFDGMTSPDEVMGWVSTNGGTATHEIIPMPVRPDQPGGSLVEIVTIDPGNGQTFTIPFFSSVDDCMIYVEKQREQMPTKVQ